MGNIPKSDGLSGHGDYKETTTGHHHPRGLTSCALFLVSPRVFGSRDQLPHADEPGRAEGVTYVVQGRVRGSMGFFLAWAVWRKPTASLVPQLVYRIMAGYTLGAVPAVVAPATWLQVTETQAPSKAVRGVEVLGLGQASCHGSWNFSLRRPGYKWTARMGD